jgi:hypothetical protein
VAERVTMRLLVPARQVQITAPARAGLMPNVSTLTRRATFEPALL